MAGHLDTFIELQQALSELNEAQQRLEGVPEWMQELHGEHQAYQTEIDQVQAAAEEAEKDRRTAEAAVEDSQIKLNNYQEQISQVSTQREYKALLKEIDAVKTLITDYEEQAFAALESHEEAETQLREKRAGFRELNERYQLELTKWDEEKPSIQSEVERLQGQVEVLRERVPRGPLAQFNRLLERHQGRALAPIAKVDRSGPNMWHCGFCNYRVRPQVVMDIRNNGNLTPCESCHRFLYVEDPAAS